MPQAAFGWDDTHPHRFETEAGDRGRGRILTGAVTGRTRLVDLLAAPGDQAL